MKELKIKSGSSVSIEEVFEDCQSLSLGFRFYPTDKKLILDYLKRKICRRRLTQRLMFTSVNPVNCLTTSKTVFLTLAIKVVYKLLLSDYMRVSKVPIEANGCPQETLQVLDVVMRESPSHNYVPVLRSFFSPQLGRRSAICDGMEYWNNFSANKPVDAEVNSVKWDPMGTLLASSSDDVTTKLIQSRDRLLRSTLRLFSKCLMCLLLLVHCNIIQMFSRVSDFQMVSTSDAEIRLMMWCTLVNQVKELISPTRDLNKDSRNEATEKEILYKVKASMTKEDLAELVGVLAENQRFQAMGC